jgi:hypothetical protein
MIRYMLNHPRILALALLLIMWALTLLGTVLRKRFRPPAFDDKDDTALVVSASLTLLGLIIGFTFSMATSRYDLRRTYEEGEANAISTEWLRADLLPAPDAARLRGLLSQYLDARIGFYLSPYSNKTGTVDARSALLQDQMWSTILPIARSQPTPMEALVVTGLDEVISSEGRTQAAWWNRIPTTAWVLLVIIACMANLLVGYATRSSQARTLLLVVLPMLVSTAILLIADIDSPRGGLIRIPPRDLAAIRQTLPKS